MKPTYETIKNYDLFFVVLDTLNLANAKIDTDILSPTFLQLIDININGHKLDNRFIAISHAIDTLYQDERTDMIPYAPPSVFYNMIDLLKDYDKAIQGLDALLYKSGCFIYQFPSKSKISGATYDAIKTSNYILEQKSNGSVISIQKDADIKDFPLSNINGLIEAVNKLEDAITKALNDTPASILFDRQLSNGFSNGDKDKETEIQIVNTFRQNKIKPLYELTDYYVMLKAWNEDFINEIKEKYTDLSKYSNIQLFKKWQDDFVFEFGNLYPEPESITIENNSKKLDNLLKLQQLGANASDIEAELNEDRIFKNDIDLDGQPQQFGNDNNDNENNQIDYNLYKSIFGKSKKLTKYIDANIMIDEEPPEGHEWKTLPNGEHVLINSESGEIVSGIDGAKPQPKKTENKSNSSNTKTISKKEYLSNKKAIQYRKDLIEFHKRELENIHPNDKLNRKIKEDEIAELENAEDYQKWIKENEEYEKENPKTNAEKDRQSARSGENNTKEKPKKITKNYSISYDDETIEKLNKLGKNWKDKRIYFKDLNNSYYDLENEKWVCDKPETTEKALMIAGETETEKTARLEAEKQEAEKQEAEKRQAKEKAEKERKEYLREYNKKTMNRIYNEDDNYISNKFYKEVGKAMYQNGIFEEGYIPSGSINKIKSQLFTNEEIKNWDELYENSINDIVYKAVKSNLEDINDMYKPMKWGDWLWREKDLNNGSQSVNDLEDLTDEDPDLIREELNAKYIKNNVAWEKFGEEFNKYKENYKKEAKEKIKEYIKKNYADSKIDTKIKIDSADYKSESEIDNDIEYYIDNLINYADAKKEFDESKIKRDKFGRFAKKNGNKDNDKIKDTDNKGTDDDGGNSKKYISKCIKSLPKHLQPIGKRLYSGEYEGGELVYKSKYAPIGGNHIDQDKLNNLSDTEYSIFAFTEDGRHNSGWEERDNSDIIELIQKSPLKREALFRGEPENNIGELKVGKVINFGNKIRSFTNTEDGESIAKGFAFKYNTKKEGVRPVVYQINKPVHALCVNPLSYYQSQEDEYLCYGEFKITKVLKKKNFDFIIIEPLE